METPIYGSGGAGGAAGGAATSSSWGGGGAGGAAISSQGPLSTPSQSIRQSYPFMFKANQVVLTLKEARAVVISLHQGSPFTQNNKSLLREEAGKNVHGVYTPTGNSWLINPLIANAILTVNGTNRSPA